MSDTQYTADELRAHINEVETDALRCWQKTCAMLRAGEQAMRDLMKAEAERDVAVLAKENAERILQTLNQDDMRHQWITMKTHREAEAKARLDAEDALAKAQARVKVLEQHLANMCNCADEVGVNHFDTDTMDEDVERMQTCTLASRAALQVKP